MIFMIMVLESVDGRVCGGAVFWLDPDPAEVATFTRC